MFKLRWIFIAIAARGYFTVVSSFWGRRRRTREIAKEQSLSRPVFRIVPCEAVAETTEWTGTRVSSLDDVIYEQHLTDEQRQWLSVLRQIYGVATNAQVREKLGVAEGNDFWGVPVRSD